MNDYLSHFIDGAWRDAAGSARSMVDDAATAAPSALVAHAEAAEIHRAVMAARAAFPAWSASTPARRAGFLRAIADALEVRSEALAQAISREVGMPLKLSRRIQVDAPVAAWRQTASIGEGMRFEEEVGHSLVTQEAAGVVAAITPWNYPLHQITAKLAAALMAGCTVVLKPSELAPAAARALGEAVAQAQLPPGVVNIVFGAADSGQALVEHGEIDMVSFTGSTEVGRRIAALAGAQLKRVALELGGKSASVALPGADAERVVRHALASCLLNSGQTCSAITRLLVPQADYGRYRALLAAAVPAFVTGDPALPSTRVGPLVSARQRDRVLAIIRAAGDEGLDLVAGGSQATPSGAGHFVAPTVFGRVAATAALAREEVFGPVLAVLTYADEDDAVQQANGAGYGLAAAVWAESREQGLRLARRLRAGQVDVNGAPFNPVAPFGGFGLSGIGREGGCYGIDEYLEPRAIQLPR
nr:aldehyde dehydrogenase family protein [uncultured Noviherbaspirillum sp.]